MTGDSLWHGSMPEAYDRCLVPTLFAPFAEHLAGAARALDPESVLELAAGTGVATAALARALPHARIVATDLNAAMVSWGSERVDGVTWRQADAQHLDEPDSSFDLIACQFGVMFFPDRRAAYAEAARVLTDEGTFMFTVWDTMDTSAFTRALAASLGAVLEDDSPTFFARVPHGYAEPQRIEDDLHGAGLTEVQIDRVVLPGTASSAAALAEGFCMGTPMRFELEERGSLTALTQKVSEQMTSHLGEGEVTAELAAFLATARKPSQA